MHECMRVCARECFNVQRTAHTHTSIAEYSINIQVLMLASNVQYNRVRAWLYTAKLKSEQKQSKTIQINPLNANYSVWFEINQAENRLWPACTHTGRAECELEMLAHMTRQRARVNGMINGGVPLKWIEKKMLYAMRIFINNLL